MNKGRALIQMLVVLFVMVAGAAAYEQAQPKVSWTVTNKPEAERYLVSIPKIEVPETAEMYKPATDDIPIDELELLAMCVEAEAGNQSLYGKRLVVDVILNRVDDQSGEWPDTIFEVITQPYQFSTYWNGRIEEAIPSEETYKAVIMELEGRTNKEILYFTAEGYGDYGTPWKKIEDHYFCTW